MKTTEAQNLDQPSRRWRMPDSIYVKCMILLALCSALTIGLVTFKSIRATDAVANASVMEIGAAVVRQLGARSGAAVQFRKSDDIAEMLNETIAGLNGSAAGAIVLAKDGEILAQEFLEGQPADVLLKAAQSALETGEYVEIADRLVIAVPIKYGPNQSIIGVIGLDWRSEVLFSIVDMQNRVSLAMAIGVGILMLIVAGFLIKRMVAHPLLEVAGAIQEVAKGNYDIVIPKYRRGNEIGVVAKGLEQFRDQLAGSEATRKDSAMKSAALDAGSAAIMISDADFNIVYASPTVLGLLKDHSNLLQSRIKGFEPEKVVGSSIDNFLKLIELEREALASLNTDGHYANLEMDDTTLELRLSKIDNADGQRIGYVAEWADVTEEKLNSAILDSLDANQARAEFDEKGRLVDANSSFLALAGIQDPSEASEFKNMVFAADNPADPEEAVFQEYQIRREDGAFASVLGGLSPIRSSKGALKRTVLIGADVTDERSQKIAAETERKRLQQEQDALITSLSDSLSVLAEGDLTVRITTVFSGANDQIRTDFNRALEKLDEAINSVTSSASTIRSEVKSVASAAVELSGRTEHQAATLQETASALSEISASVSSSAEGAKNANDVVASAQSDAQNSGGVVRDAVSAMAHIAESSSEITSIVKVIDDIAFQTNLLALNAGVEAARAGDAGRGFAVVASEVRALAQRSSEAASEISSLISASSDNVDLGVTLVDNAGEALEHIISSISDISNYVSQIATASQEQSLSISEISSAMSQLDQVTQQNAAMFEETTAASQTLADAADDLTDRVERFTTRGKRAEEIQEGQARPAEGTDASFETERWAS